LLLVGVAAAIGCSLRFDPGPRRTGTSGGGSTLTAPPPTNSAPPAGGTFEDRRCGGLGYADAPCDSCFRTHCCVDGITCGSNRECVALRDCWAMCETEECAAQCESEHSAGTYDSEQLDGCMESYCASACE
jgi:hypothetical protein